MNESSGMVELAAVLTKDRPGELAKVVTAIANMGINIEGFCEVEGRFHVVTNDPKAARTALETVGFKVTEREVFVIEAEDRPGFLARILRRLSEAELNVGATYTLTKTRIAFTVDQPARAKELLPELQEAATRAR